jgi:hypothetical protein
MKMWKEFRNKGKATPDRPWAFQQVEAPRFQDNRPIKVVGLSALRTGRFYPPGNIPGTHFCQMLSRPHGHSAAGRIMSMQNSNDTIGESNPRPSACNAVPQPTAPPHALTIAYVKLCSGFLCLCIISPWGCRFIAETYSTVRVYRWFTILYKCRAFVGVYWWT